MLISLYANNSKLYQRITTINEALILQSDSDAFSTWSELWRLNFIIKTLSVCRSLKVNYGYM